MGKKTTMVKEKIQSFGVKKFSVLIIGLIICLVGILYIALHNAQGGLLEITYEDYQTFYKEKVEKKIVFIGGDDEISREFLPILNEVLKKERVQANYLDIAQVITDGNETAFQELSPVTKESYMIPMVMVIENKKVIDSIQGYTDEGTLTKFIQKNK